MNAYRLGLLVAASLGVTLFMGADGCFSSETRDVPIGGHDAGPGVACGSNTCASGEVCCNASCGICTAPGEACIAIGCETPPPPGGEPCGAVTCAAGETCCNPSCGTCVGPTESCSADECTEPPPPPPPTCEPASCGPAPGADPMCPDGTSAEWVCQQNADGSCGWFNPCAGPGPGECGADECGPPPPLPRCPDGETPPPTCARQDDGVCRWLIPRCGDPTDCSDAECGPAPGVPSMICPDGSVAGPECSRDPAGICGWHITTCAEPPPPEECADPSACGPSPGAPTIMCWDGSIGGFTGRCVHTPAACPGADCDCGWEFRDCPPMPSGEPCGPVFCGDETVCCNASCGICARPDEGCVTIACEPPVCVGEVACDSLPPDCGPGMVPSISGACWGECVRAEACERVDCSSPVICAAPEPRCEPGYVASRSGGCWGPCVPADLCEGGAPVRCNSPVLCDRVPPTCPDGQVPSVVGDCYGECVPIDSCECAGPSDCPMPDVYTCHMFRNRCGPFVG